MGSFDLQFGSIQCMGSIGPVLDRLEAAGYEAYLVGGCVRDAVFGMQRIGEGAGPERHKTDGAAGQGYRTNTDIDVTTSARPEEVRVVFGELTVIDTGIKHGTVTVLVPLGEEDRREAASMERLPVEVTTFRSDGEYSDGRHPDSVRFVASIEEDLARRDLTINAMAMDVRGKLVDPFGGREDLAAGIVRTVGDPVERFREDGLRILRTLRFASVLGFDIEKETAGAVHAQKELLKQIAPERIFVELKKLIVGESAGNVLREYIDVIEVVIPELGDMNGFEQHNPYHSYDVLEHCIRALETVETTDENNEYMKLAALLHDIGKPSTFTMDEAGIGHFYGHPAAGEEMCRVIMNRLRSDRATKDRVCTLVENHDLLFEQRDRLLKRWLRKFGSELLLEILALKRADNIATGNASDELIEKFDAIGERISQLVEEGACFKIGDLAIDGRELIGEGIAEGPMLGRILDRLLEEVMDGKKKNDRRQLLEEARRIGSGS